jgi:hypothetical protein
MDTAYFQLILLGAITIVSMLVITFSFIKLKPGSQIDALTGKIILCAIVVPFLLAFYMLKTLDSQVITALLGVLIGVVSGNRSEGKEREN